MATPKSSVIHPTTMERIATWRNQLSVLPSPNDPEEPDMIQLLIQTDRLQRNS
jgi:predicted Zn-dependent protease